MPAPQNHIESLRIPWPHIDGSKIASNGSKTWKIAGQPGRTGHIDPSTGAFVIDPAESEERQFNVITLVLLSFFVGVFWGAVGTVIWYSFNP